MEKVTVLIPIGPKYNLEWLKEAIDSVLEQTYKVNELFIIDDGANLSIPDCHTFISEPGYAENCYYERYYNIPYFSCSHYTKEMIQQRGGKGCWHVSGSHNDRDLYLSYWRSPCNLGFTAAFNVGMALANNDLVVYLAADDKLMPTAVEQAVQTYLDNDKKDAWYAYTYQSSSGDVCSIPINAAMITKNLWKMVGGYPPAGFVGPDALILSCLLAHAPDRIIHIDEGEPLYWFRDHPEQETKTHTWKYVDEMTSIRSKYTEAFKFNE